MSFKSEVLARLDKLEKDRFYLECKPIVIPPTDACGTSVDGLINKLDRAKSVERELCRINSELRESNKRLDDENVRLRKQVSELQANRLYYPSVTKFLGTEDDYRSAPDGTIVVDGGHNPFVKRQGGWFGVSLTFGISTHHTDYSMALDSRRVLRWGNGETS